MSGGRAGERGAGGGGDAGGGPRFRMIECWKLHAHGLLTAEDTTRVLKQMSVVSAPGGFAKGQLAALAPCSAFDTAVTIAFFLGVLGSFLYLPAIALALVVFRMWWELVLFVGVMVVLAVVPVPYHPSLNFWPFVDSLTAYSSYRLVVEEDITQYTDEPASFGLVGPHGVFPLQNIFAHFHLPRLFGRFVRGLAADAVLAMPVMRQFLIMMGAVSATKANGLKYLKEGFVCGVSPDGIGGIFHVNDPNEVLLILSRRGIYDIALRAGKPIICTYTFGNTAAFRAWYDSSGLLAGVSRYLRTSLFLFWGRWGLPLPFRVAITTVVGRPLAVRQVAHPTDKDIGDLRARVLLEYQRIFEQHKRGYGWEHKKLVFK